MKMYLSRNKAPDYQSGSNSYFLSFRRPYNCGGVGYTSWGGSEPFAVMVDAPRFHRGFAIRLRPGEGPIQVDLELRGLGGRDDY